MQSTESQILSLLVKMADDFDRAGEHDLASEVDDTITSRAARFKAPLKQLDDDIKNNLIIFIHDADQNTSNSVKGLRELFRRLRYFDLMDSIKELGLDKVVKEMEKTQGCLDGAKKKFYELMHGKKPSKQDLTDLFEQLTGKEDNAEGPLDFFEQQAKDEDEEGCPDPGKKRRSDEKGKGFGFGEGEGPIGKPICEKLEEKEDEEDDLDEELEAELEKFMASLEGDEE